MGHRFIEFDKVQREGMLNMFSPSMVGKIHICIDSNQDYTLCGHATDEYNTNIVKKRPTCQQCLDVVKDCKLIKEE